MFEISIKIIKKDGRFFYCIEFYIYLMCLIKSWK